MVWLSLKIVFGLWYSAACTLNTPRSWKQNAEHAGHGPLISQWLARHPATVCKPRDRDADKRSHLGKLNYSVCLQFTWLIVSTTFLARTWRWLSPLVTSELFITLCFSNRPSFLGRAKVLDAKRSAVAFWWQVLWRVASFDVKPHGVVLLSSWALLNMQLVDASGSLVHGSHDNEMLISFFPFSETAWQPPTLRVWGQLTQRNLCAIKRNKTPRI